MSQREFYSSPSRLRPKYPTLRGFATARSLVIPKFLIQMPTMGVCQLKSESIPDDLGELSEDQKRQLNAIWPSRMKINYRSLCAEPRGLTIGERQLYSIATSGA